jgi:hypothetical protein
MSCALVNAPGPAALAAGTRPASTPNPESRNPKPRTGSAAWAQSSVEIALLSDRRSFRELEGLSGHPVRE